MQEFKTIADQGTINTEPLPKSIETDINDFNDIVVLNPNLGPAAAVQNTLAAGQEQENPALRDEADTTVVDGQWRKMATDIAERTASFTKSDKQTVESKRRENSDIPEEIKSRKGLADQITSSIKDELTTLRNNNHVDPGDLGEWKDVIAKEIAKTLKHGDSSSKIRFFNGVVEEKGAGATFKSALWNTFASKPRFFTPDYQVLNAENTPGLVEESFIKANKKILQ